MEDNYRINGQVPLVRDHGFDRWRTPKPVKDAKPNAGLLYRSGDGWELMLYRDFNGGQLCYRSLHLGGPDPAGYYDENTAVEPWPDAPPAPSGERPPDFRDVRMRSVVSVCETCEHYQGKASTCAVLCGRKGRGRCRDCHVLPTTTGDCPLQLWPTKLPAGPTTPSAA